MKKSISTWSFPSAWPLEARLRLAHEAGFAGFEIEFTENEPSDFAGLRATAESLGIELSGLATGLYWNNNPASAVEAVRHQAAEILRRQIEGAAALGIDAVLVVPGSVGVDFIPGAEVIPYEIAWERARAFIAAALPLAEARGVTLGIENVWNKFLLSPREMREFIDSFGSERVASWFDVGNVLATGYPEDWIATLGPRIRRVHVKDYRRAVGGLTGFVELLSGDVNWPAVMTALRTARYDGWITAEMIPPAPFYQHCPEVLIHNTSRALDAILAL